MKSFVINGYVLRYVPHKTLRLRKTAKMAISVAESVQRIHDPANHLPKNQRELFVALHACAYYAQQANARSRDQECEEWVNRHRIIKNFIAAGNMGLAVATASRYRTMDEDSVMSNANFTLLQAIDNYSPWHGAQFSTYAMGSIFRRLAHTYRLHSKQRDRCPYLYDEERPEIDDTRLGPNEIAARNEELDWLYEYVYRDNMAELSDRELYILSKRYPARGKRSNYRDIAQTLGLKSSERVRQIKNRAIEKIRESVGEETLAEMS